MNLSSLYLIRGNNMCIDIVKYIPFGKENAICREKLCAETGLPDRSMRDLINQARKRTVIINLQNGSGYYRPTQDDRADVEKFKRQEENRAKEIFKGLQPVRKFLAQ